MCEPFSLNGVPSADGPVRCETTPMVWRAPVGSSLMIFDTSKFRVQLSQTHASGALKSTTLTTLKNALSGAAVVGSPCAIEASPVAFGSVVMLVLLAAPSSPPGRGCQEAERAVA